MQIITCEFNPVKLIQWNLCNPDTLGPAVSVLIIKVSLFSRFVSIAPSNTFTQVCTILLPVHNDMHVMYSGIQCTSIFLAIKSHCAFVPLSLKKSVIMDCLLDALYDISATVLTKELTIVVWPFCSRYQLTSSSALIASE